MESINERRDMANAQTIYPTTIGNDQGNFKSIEAVGENTVPVPGASDGQHPKVIRHVLGSKLFPVINVVFILRCSS